jgi:hypothetical protein
MMKFKGEINQFHGDIRKGRRKKDRVSHLHYIPTVNEVDEVMAPMIADTILQILRGQGIYWGWEIDRDVDNALPYKAPINPDDFTFGKGPLPPLPLVRRLKTRHERRMYYLLREIGKTMDEAKEIVFKVFPMETN